MNPDHRLRLAELLSALSVVTDLGIGRPAQAAMHACLLATRLADAMDLPAAARSDVYYATLLRYIGCTAYAHEEAVQAGGDELDARAESTRADFADPRELLSFIALRLGRNEPVPQRVLAVALGLPRTILKNSELVA